MKGGIVVVDRAVARVLAVKRATARAVASAVAVARVRVVAVAVARAMVMAVVVMPAVVVAVTMLAVATLVAVELWLRSIGGGGQVAEVTAVVAKKAVMARVVERAEDWAVAVARVVAA